jgi:hypothetical protein
MRCARCSADGFRRSHMRIDGAGMILRFPAVEVVRCTTATTRPHNSTRRGVQALRPMRRSRRGADTSPSGTGSSVCTRRVTQWSRLVSTSCDFSRA